ncbi:MAG: insulinase family protein, partial [Ramlibacter sp.]
SRGEHPHIADLAATLFGGGMSAPLVDAVRERLGLAYSVSATADIGDVHGALVVDAITSPDKLPAFTAELSRLLAGHATGVAEKDLSRARNQLLVSLVRSAERPMRFLQRCVEHQWATGQAFDSDAASEAINSISKEEVRGVFEAMLTQPPATVLVGAGATLKNARALQAALRR